MSNEQLFQQVSFLLQRNLTPEERKFLALAGQTIRLQKDLPPKAANGKSRIDKIAV